MYLCHKLNRTFLAQFKTLTKTILSTAPLKKIASERVILFVTKIISRLLTLNSSLLVFPFLLGIVL